jgi:hypothetical protein
MLPRHEQYNYKRFLLRKPDGSRTTVSIHPLLSIRLLRAGYKQAELRGLAQGLYTAASQQGARIKSKAVAAGLENLLSGA